MGCHILEVGLGQFDLGDFADLDPVEPHLAALAQTIDRAREIDVIEVEIAVEADARQPDRKDHDPEEQQ